MRRRRYQKGSLQKRRHGKQRVWVVQYYDAEGHHRYHPLGRQCDMNKSRADEEQAAFMRTINGGDPEPDTIRPVLLGEFVNLVYLPFYRGKWKRSTKGTSEDRIRAHIIKDLGNEQMVSLSTTGLQAYLESKAATRGFSLVDHLRWDLTSIGDLAVAEKVLPTNPASQLYTPTSAKKGARRVMTADDAEAVVGAVEFREKVIVQLTIFAGLRPGEILALQRRHVAQDRSSVEIEQRVYRGDIDRPKNGESRFVAVPPRTAAVLAEWLDTGVDPGPDAWVFASETRDTPLWRDNLLRRHIRPHLEALEPSLGWVDFKVMRRTNASLGHSAKVDPKVAADQRGHGIGVSLDEYTMSNLKDKAAGAKKLEDSVLSRKVVRMPKRKAS
jgi:integrase